eukprot:scaffold226_cov271-Pavlova_lutheri.AAC.3
MWKTKCFRDHKVRERRHGYRYETGSKRWDVPNAFSYHAESTTGVRATSSFRNGFGGSDGFTEATSSRGLGGVEAGGAHQVGASGK